MIANIITDSRILLSLCLLILSPYSVPFALLYALFGVSDVLDSFLARKLHTESKTDERLDSIANYLLAAVYGAKIPPLLCLPVWIWIWTALIAAVTFFGILNRLQKEQRFCIAHSFAN